MAEAPESLLYQPVWRQGGSALSREGQGPGGRWLLFGQRGGALDGLAGRLADEGGEPMLVRPGRRLTLTNGEASLDPRSPSEHRELLARLNGSLRGVVHAWATAQLSPWEEPAPEGLLSALFLIQALADAQPEGRPRVFLVTRGAQPVRRGSDRVVPGQTALWGLGRAAAFEQPALDPCLIDLDPGGSRDDAGALHGELLAERSEDEVAFRDGRRFLGRLALLDLPASPSPVRFRSDAGYLVVGGLGGLGMTVARWMAERGVRRLVLMQRSSPAEDGNRALQRLRGLGATVEVVQGDVTSEEDVARAVALASKGATLRGVVHSAAALDDDLIVRQSAERFETVLAPKVRGALNLHRQTASAELDHFVLFSSGASFMGPPGQSNYSAANNFIDGLVARRRVDGLPGLAVNWGAWGEVGGAVRLGLMKTLGRFGVAPISPADGMAALERLMAANVEQAAVLRVDWPRFVERVWLGDTPPLMRELVQPDHASELAQQRRAGSIMPPSASA